MRFANDQKHASRAGISKRPVNVSNQRDYFFLTFSPRFSPPFSTFLFVYCTFLLPTQGQWQKRPTRLTDGRNEYM